MMKRTFNLKMAVTPKDDKLYEILLNSLEGTESTGKNPNFKRLRQEHINMNLGILKQENRTKEN